METLIKLNPSEINQNLLKVLKTFLNGRNNFEITINVKEVQENNFSTAEPKPEYKKKLDAAINNIENGKNLVSFTFDEFEAFSKKLLKNEGNKI